MWNWLQLLDTQQPLTSVCPEVVPAVRMLEVADQVWPLPQRRRARRAAQQPAPPSDPVSHVSAAGEDAFLDIDQGSTDLPDELTQQEQIHEGVMDVLEVADALNRSKGRKRKVSSAPEISTNVVGGSSSSTSRAHLPAPALQERIMESEPSHAASGAAPDDMPSSVAVASSDVVAALAVEPVAPEQAVADEAAPKAPPPPEPPVRVASVRMAAAATVTLESGQISFYPLKQCFQATCSKHPSCVLTRTCNGRTSRGATTGGRPIGFMASWLGLAPQCATKQEHWQRERWSEALNQDVRLAARQTVLRATGGVELANFERERVDGEPEEPHSLQGLIR